MVATQPPPSPHPAVLAIALSLLAAGCGGRHAEAALELGFAVPADLRELRVHVPSGSLTFEASDEARIAIEGRTRRWSATDELQQELATVPFAPSLEPVEGEAGAYALRFPDLPERLDPKRAALIVKASVRVPAGISLSVDTTRGDLAVVGQRGAVRLRTGSGSLLVKRVTGAVDVETGHGAVVVVEQRGDLRAVTGGETLLAYIEELGPHGATLATQSPSMIVHLPPHAAFTLDARVLRSNEGKIGVRTAYGVPVERDGRGHRARGDVHGGGPLVDLEVGRGYLSVVPLPTR
ncbi:MAG: hypothetical protein IPM29_10020 [Planctomycetes bacterium]|nr:hypothetical protein [Planctomycetota bacterium]